MKGEERDPYCKVFSASNNNYCTECYKGYLAIHGGCKEQNPLCKTIKMANGDCETCWPGFSLVQGDCVVGEQATTASTKSGVVDVYCIKIVNGVCNECSNGYYYHKNDQICKQADPLCKDYNKDNGDCTDCYRGYSLNSGSGKCVTAQAV